MSWPHRIFASQFSDFELKLLRVFRVVVDCDGFSLAESELGLTKSAISKHVSDLEIRLGVRLCERGRSGFALTSEGKVVYDSTTQLLVALEEFRSRINSVHSELIGEFYVGFLENLVTHQDPLLQQILAEYVRAHPGLKLRMVVGSAREIDHAVEERRLHIGISVKSEASDKVVSVPLLSEIGYLYCGREHELFNLEDPQISDELLSRCALVQHGYSATESRLITQLRLNPQAISHQSEGILFLVLAGWHIGFLPAHYAKAWVASGSIRAIRTADVKKETHLAIKAHRASLDNPMIENFLSVARTLKDKSAGSAGIRVGR